MSEEVAKERGPQIYEKLEEADSEILKLQQVFDELYTRLVPVKTDLGGNKKDAEVASTKDLCEIGERIEQGISFKIASIRIRMALLLDELQV